MVRYRAAWVLPIAQPPVRGGWVEIVRDRVAGVSGGNDTSSEARDVDLGDVAILPGLVNAHTHLELSYMRDAVAPCDNFVSWIRQVVALRRQQADASADCILSGVDEGINEAVACGTALVGDISNTLVTCGPLMRSVLAGVVFYELLGFRAQAAEAAVEEARARIAALGSEDVRPSLAAHAPYSVSPAMLKALAGKWGRVGISGAADGNAYPTPFSVHLAESVEEVEFIRSATGPWRTFLEEMGSWDSSFAAPAASPVDYLSHLGALGPHTLAVHGVQMSSADLATLAKHGATLVTCPRSNARTGAGVPPVGRFYESGVRVAVGTDSLASTPDLNVFSELAAMRALAPDVPAASLLESATRNGAVALGFDDFGTIASGQRARLLAVDIPHGCDDVEEYLVGGIQPGDIRWLDAQFDS